MKHNDPVKNMMSEDILSAHKSMKLSEVRQLFINNHFHHLPVTDGEQLIGILSFTDILRIDAGDLYQQAPEQSDALLDNLSSVEELMTKEVTTIGESTPVREAVDILSRGNFHAIPVTEDNRLKGMVTSTDLFKYFLAQY